jgi:hypothetical protein
MRQDNINIHVVWPIIEPMIHIVIASEHLVSIWFSARDSNLGANKCK